MCWERETERERGSQTGTQTGSQTDAQLVNPNTLLASFFIFWYVYCNFLSAWSCFIFWYWLATVIVFIAANVCTETHNWRVTKSCETSFFCHIDEGVIQYINIGFTDVAHNQCPLPYWAGNTQRMHVPMLKECFTSQSFGSQTVDYNQCLLPHWARSISLAYVGMLKKECFVTHYFGTRMAQHKNAFLIGHVDILLIAVKSRGKWQHPATGSLLAAWEPLLIPFLQSMYFLLPYVTAWHVPLLIMLEHLTVLFCGLLTWLYFLFTRSTDTSFTPNFCV